MVNFLSASGVANIRNLKRTVLAALTNHLLTEVNIPGVGFYIRGSGAHWVKHAIDMPTASMTSHLSGVRHSDYSSLPQHVAPTKLHSAPGQELVVPLGNLHDCLAF